MTRKEYLSKLPNELNYDEERLRVVVELLNANPDMSVNDFDVAWATSKHGFPKRTRIPEGENHLAAHRGLQRGRGGDCRY
jgi:hypothetical protein